MSEPQYGFTQNYYTKYFVSMLLFLNLSLCAQLLLAFSSKVSIKQQAKKEENSQGVCDIFSTRFGD